MPSGAPGVRFVFDTPTITGGTGRFAGAAGSFTTERRVDATAGTVTGLFERTLSANPLNARASAGGTPSA